MIFLSVVVLCVCVCLFIIILIVQCHGFICLLDCYYVYSSSSLVVSCVAFVVCYVSTFSSAVALLCLPFCFFPDASVHASSYYCYVASVDA